MKTTHQAHKENAASVSGVAVGRMLKYGCSDLRTASLFVLAPYWSSTFTRVNSLRLPYYNFYFPVFLSRSPRTCPYLTPLPPSARVKDDDVVGFSLAAVK